MRSLNSSLPAARSAGPPEQLLQAFRAAALSVTNLYKTAASEQSPARHSGYQDALEDLNAFLDAEHIGLGDGEGWRVRQWAAEKLDVGHVGRPVSARGDSDDEKADSERGRSSSPVAPPECSRSVAAENHGQQPTSATSSRHAAASSSIAARTEDHSPTPPEFLFRSALPMPKGQEVEMVSQDHDTPGVAQHRRKDGCFSPTPSNKSGPSVRFEVGTRAARHRHGSGNSRITARGTANLGAGAGLKRKLPYSEFFELAGIGNIREVFGNSAKRGRFGRESSE